MRDQHLQTIREACIKANPEIVSTKTVAVIDPIDRHVSSRYEAYAGTRPIRLADVLLAIVGKSNCSDRADVTFEVVDRWSLRKDDLTEQSDECLEFLAELLK